MKKFNKHLLVLFLAVLFISSAQAQNNTSNKPALAPVTTASEQVAANSPTKVTPLLIGASIPEVNLKSIEGKEFNLASLVKNKPAVFIFYRGGW